MTTNFPLEAHQDSLALALQAPRAFARGGELRGIDDDESEEAFVSAWDWAREAGVICGRHDLPVPFALTQVPQLVEAYEEGEAEGRGMRELDADDALFTQSDLFDVAA